MKLCDENHEEIVFDEVTGNGKTQPCPICGQIADYEDHCEALRKEFREAWTRLHMLHAEAHPRCEVEHCGTAQWLDIHLRGARTTA